MRGLPPDDRAEGDHRLDALGTREVPGGKRELERSRHPHHGRVPHPVPVEHPERALEQPVHEAGVEAGGHDADSRSGDFVFSFDDVVGGHARRAPFRSVAFPSPRRSGPIRVAASRPGPAQLSMYSTTSSPNPDRPWIRFGALSTRIRRTPRSSRIRAPTP